MRYARARARRPLALSRGAVASDVRRVTRDVLSRDGESLVRRPASHSRALRAVHWRNLTVRCLELVVPRRCGSRLVYGISCRHLETDRSLLHQRVALVSRRPLSAVERANMYGKLADNTHRVVVRDAYGCAPRFVASSGHTQLEPEPEVAQEDRQYSASSGLSVSAEYVAAQRVDFEERPQTHAGTLYRTSTIGSAGYLATTLGDPRWGACLSKSHQRSLLAARQRLAFSLLLSQRADVMHSFFAVASDDADIIGLIGQHIESHRCMWRTIGRDNTRVAAELLVAETMVTVETGLHADSDSSWEYTSDESDL